MDLDMQQKHERLVQKYQEEKEKLKAFKEGFREKKDQCDALQEQMKILEAQVMQLMEDNDTLRHENQIGKKQLQSAAKQAEDSKKSAWPSIDMGFLKNNEMVQKLDGEKTVLQEELNRKIEENETVHIQVFHLRQSRDKLEEDMLVERENHASAMSEMQKKMDASNETIEQLKTDAGRLRTNVQAVRAESALSRKETMAIKEQLDAAVDDREKLGQRLHRCAPLLLDSFTHVWTDEPYELYSQMALRIFDKYSPVLHCWLRLNEKESNDARMHRWSTKLTLAVQKMESLCEQGKEILQASACQLLADPHYRVNEVIRPLHQWGQLFTAQHRDFTLYQSLLWTLNLQEISSISEGFRATKSSVDHMWRLHQRLRRFIARVKISFLCFGGTSLSVSNAHFSIFRNNQQHGVRVRRASVAKLIQESTTQLLLEWESLGKSLSSRVAASHVHLTQAAVQPVLEALHHLCALGPHLTPERRAVSRDCDSAKRCFVETASAACKQQPSIPYHEALELRQKFDTIKKLKTELSSELTRLQRDLRDQQADKQRLEDELRLTQDKYALVEANMRAADAGRTNTNDAGNVVSELKLPPSPVSLGTPLPAALVDLKAAVHIVTEDSDAYPLTTGTIVFDDAKACESDIKKVYRQHLNQLESELRKSNDQILEISADAEKARRRLERYEEEKIRYLKDMERIDKNNGDARMEVDEIKKSYDRQIQILSEHLCTLTENLSTKDASLAEVQACEVLCSMCGSWSKIGNVLASGACPHCQQTLLRT